MSKLNFEVFDVLNQPKKTELTREQHQAVELAFVIQDPCGETATQLAAQVLGLIRDRDDVTCLALISEVKCLRGKYPHNNIGGNDETKDSKRNSNRNRTKPK